MLKKYKKYLLDVIPGFKLLQQEHSLLGLLVALNFVFNHQWDLWDFLNAVSYETILTQVTNKCKLRQ